MLRVEKDDETFFWKKKDGWWHENKEINKGEMDREEKILTLLKIST